MQFTGILDSMGMEIYEGDIVAFDNTAIGGHKDIAEIIWLQDFCLQDNPGFAMYHKGYITETFMHATIIGNIYQNPELISSIST
jgi:uncharacterized phage protein (TIGR01671 family)